MNKRLKILQTIRQGKIGGGERHVIDLVEGINKEQFEPIVLSFTDGEMISHLQKQGIETHVIHTEKGFDYKVWGKVTNLIKSRGVDLVHAHGTRACSNSFWSAKRAKVPCLYTVHGWSFHNDQPFIQKNVRSFLEGLLLKNVDATVLVSENNFQEAQRLFLPKKSFLIKNGVNLTRFDVGVESPVRQEFHISDDAFLVGYIARITKQKDPFTMVRAISEVIKHNDNIRLLMVGSGELEQEVKELAKTMGVEHVIYFVPFRNDVPEILKAIDVYCLPSLWEGLPIGILEAMAMAKPIVATNIGGNSELVTHGENGFLCPTGSYEKIAEAILKLATDKSLKTSFGNNSRVKIMQEFAVSDMVLKIEKLYREFL